MEQKKQQAKEGKAEEQAKKTHPAEQEKKQDEDSLKKEFAELKETLQRVQAEFENSRKRLEKEKHDFAMLANAGLVKELLPLLDSVDAAEKHLAGRESISKQDALKAQQAAGPQGECDCVSGQDALKGIELIKKQLLAILSSHGLREIRCVGQKFDPMLHDCLMQGNEKGKQDNCVLQEIQKGYLLNGKVLRHSKVKVNKI